MPVIQCGGMVIAWSGIQAGPLEEYEPIGTPSGWMRYEAEVGNGGAETAKVVVRIQKSWRKSAPETVLTVEAKEQQIVTRFIEEQLAGNRPPLDNGTTTNFTIASDDMLKRYRAL